MSGLVLQVDPNLHVPVYEQLRSQVARMVASGTLALGTRLPTIRQLASDLGLAKGTIERAYLLLEADGLVESRGRAGTFVRERATATAGIDPGEELAAVADTMAVAVLQLGITTDEAVVALRQALERHH
ncbi:MAG: GntR family transcriptional regulator [Actinomycetota bacterium]|nr:GntR family transcriptional regulator [Actinomycetota bacterium]